MGGNTEREGREGSKKRSQFGVGGRENRERTKQMISRREARSESGLFCASPSASAYQLRARGIEQRSEEGRDMWEEKRESVVSGRGVSKGRMECLFGREGERNRTEPIEGRSKPN